MANILVVEDEQLIARLLKETLLVEGYQAVTVLNGEDAVQFALREIPWFNDCALIPRACMSPSLFSVPWVNQRIRCMLLR